MVLIGLSGAIGAGKTTVAARLVEQHGFKEYYFAKKLKEIIADLCQYDLLALNSGPWREQLDPKYGKSPRQIMQQVGTAMRDIITTDIWIDYLMRSLPEGDIVISDARFPNEQRRIIDEGGIIIILMRGEDTTSESKHISETSYLAILSDPLYADKVFVVDNNGPIDETMSHIMDILADKKLLG
jgi:hypothetical protein